MMKDKVLSIITSSLLVIQGILPIYGIFFTFSIYKSIPVFIVDASIFFTLALFSYIKFHNRFVQWIAIIYSLIRGFGGFLGLGWAFAIVLAILYIIGGKKKDHPNMQNPPTISTDTNNSNFTQPEQFSDESTNQQ